MPQQANPYSEHNVAKFLRKNLRDNTVLRYQLLNLFDGVREQSYQQGYAKAKREQKEIVEDIIL